MDKVALSFVATWLFNIIAFTILAHAKGRPWREPDEAGELTRTTILMLATLVTLGAFVAAGVVWMILESLGAW